MGGGGTRLAAAKKVIRKIVSNTDLTSGAYFGLMEWGTRHRIRVNIGPNGASRIFNNVNGFDQVYLLPGLNNMIGDESLDVETGASKAQLKRAFGKMANGKITNRPLLTNFVKMVA